MTFKEVLELFRRESFSEREKGAKFEKLIKRWLQSDPRYKDKLQKVWMWDEFPSKSDLGSKDLGIDLVAKTDIGDYWAIQCKCYDSDKVIDKPMLDSFIATAHRKFKDELTLQETSFSNLIWVSTTSHWNNNAEESLKNQDIPITRINTYELEASPVDWEKIVSGKCGKEVALSGKNPMKHQLEAMSEAHKYYASHDKGKLIMACGTGKTFTALEIVEQELNNKGLVLYMVPSIALIGQSLNEWMSNAKCKMKAVCICSDPKASQINKDEDDTEDSIIDTPYPATTNIEIIKKQLLKYKDFNGLVVVFSTYQSIDALSNAQKALIKASNGYGEFDFIVCDEAHRTTGIKVKGRDESMFTKIHNNDIVKGKKRMYMTATPRYIINNPIISAKNQEVDLWSMDDTQHYGEEFFRIGFGRAVRDGLLTDYKVLVLTISDDDIPDKIKDELKKDGEHSELRMDDASKLIGCINGLSKRIRGDNGITKEQDPLMMHRALAFCATINHSAKGGISSKEFAAAMPSINQKYKESLTEKEREDVADIETKHIDGTMDTAQREDLIAWLKEDTGENNKCRILSNVRCLSEGVDVPALDAVLFVAAKNSEIDVVQSVGRVMRSFHKGQNDEKKYGYIIIPVVVPDNVKPEDALDDNERFATVWTILNSLRSHDEEFNAHINKIELNKNKPSKITVAEVPKSSWGMESNPTDSNDAKEGENAYIPSQEEIAQELALRFGELQNGIYAKMVEKVGDRLYWENWAKQVGLIAQNLIERIAKIVQNGSHKDLFEKFVVELQKNLNPSVDEGQAIEMLAQHMITRPVFDALFKDYQFVANNSVSGSMQKMIDILEKEGLDKDLEVLDKFYENVRINVGDIDNLEGKQTIIKNLYEKFFKGAFPKTVEKLGIVYTPVECVDFIIHSVNEILKKEFSSSLSDENVHILDPFVGTGTFITRLLQSGLIKPEDMERKYLNEIHCNEIVLLAYYIADVNIESVFHDVTQRKEYLPYDGICLTDTFQTAEIKDPIFDKSWFPENSEGVEKLLKTPIRVIMANPPYSIGQRSANDNAKNQSYPHVDGRITETYVKESTADLNKSTYDAYIKAFRWASDKIAENKDGGVIGFISNGAWLDGNAQDGFRKCLEKEFSSIYVLNLRGNARTSGELRRKEGDGVFGMGSRTPIAITLLVKKPNQKEKATIYYHDIGDYLKREDKLKMLKEFKSISTKKFEWQIITPNEHGDWISMRNEGFTELIPLAPEKKFDAKTESTFTTYSLGTVTSKDPFLYNSSIQLLEESATSMINFYNHEKMLYHEQHKYNITYDPTKIVWTDSFINSLNNNKEFIFKKNLITDSLYRPFFKQRFYYQKDLIQRTYQLTKLFPAKDKNNLVISSCGLGSKKDFSILITNCIPDYQLIFNGQCFPLYWYEENPSPQGSLFGSAEDDKYIRHDGVSDWILKEFRTRLHNTKITKQMIFYYVYGLLHSKEYRETFAADLKKSLPRIPIVDTIEAFLDFEKAGELLAKLHLQYEEVKPYPGVKVIDTRAVPKSSSTTEEANTIDIAAEGDATKYATKPEYAHYRVQQMRFPAKDKKDTIIYNEHIRIENIPAEAYEYVVNGKSAIDWLVERYAITVDKGSHIKNDPNDWAIEHGKPRYILDLILSVINVSVQTVEIVKKLPKLKFDSERGETVELSDTKLNTDEILKSSLGVVPENEKDVKLDNEDTLYLTIKQDYFNQIIAGTKTTEYREIKTTTAKRYLKAGKDGGPLLNAEHTEEGKKYFLDTYNNGIFPFVPRDYKYLHLAVGYNTNRDEAIVEVNGISFSTFVRKGEHCNWLEEFHLGKIVKYTKKQ
jgi:predicted helicase